LIFIGDCLEQLKNLPDNFVDAVVTDPPYGLSFMGKKEHALTPPAFPDQLLSIARRKNG
jgi:DNA modification methylase